MKVSELFYSIQGEGPSAGVPAVFLRVPKCNLHCNGLWKCDSQEVMKTSTEMSYQDIKAFTVGMGLYEDIFMGDVHFVITGGEPLFKDQALEIMNLLDYLKPGYSELETNGTIFNRPLLERVSQVNCSPKLESSGISIQKRRNNNFFRWAAKAPNVIFKFVIASAHDFAEVRYLRDFYKIPSCKIWLMPATRPGFPPNSQKEMIWELCKENKFKYSPRLHEDLFGNKPGV